jgi:hypothetical protein
MAEVDRLAVHERATSDNASNAASLALADRPLGNTALPKGAMEPDPTDSALGALTNQIDRDVRVGGYNNAVNGFRNGSEIRIASRAFDFAGVRIEREHLVPGVAQLAVDSVGWLPRFPGYASYSDALAA